MSTMKTYKPHPKKHCANAAMTNAIAELKKTGATQRTISKKCNIPTATLQRHLKGILYKVARKPVFSEDEEADLRYCIKGMYLCILAPYFNCHYYFNILYSIIFGVSKLSILLKTNKNL